MSADAAVTRRWWTTAGIGAIICLGCCLAPLLVAVGIAGGGVALVTLSWLEPLGYALLVLGIGGIVVTRIRARRNNCGSSGCASATAGACGCATTASTS